MAQAESNPSSAPTNIVPFAPGYPKTWGSEIHKLQLSQRVEWFSRSLPSHKFLAVTSGRDIQIYNSRTLELVETLDGHNEIVHVVNFLDENVLVSVDGVRSGTVIIWRLDDEGKNIHNSGKMRLDVDGLTEAAADAVLDRILTRGGVSTEWDEQDRTNLVTAFEPVIVSFQRQHLRRRELSFKGKLFGFSSDPWLHPVDLKLDPNANPSALLVCKTGDRNSFVYVSQLASGHSEGGEEAPESSNGLKTYQPAPQDQATDSTIWTGFSPNRKMLAIVSWDQYARIYATPSSQTKSSDAAPFKLLHKIGPTGGQNWVGAWHPSSEYFAFSQGSPRTVVYVYRILLPDQSEGGTGRAELIHTQSAFIGWCRSMAWSPDGKMLLCAAENKVLLYNPFTGTIDRDFTFTPEPKSTDKGGDNKTSRRLPLRLECRNAQWISQSRFLWTTGDAGIEIYDRDKELRYRWEPGEEDKWSLGSWSNQVVLADGRMVVADGDSAVRVWDIPS